jgi:sugar lactone lactonase YvrE
MSKTLTITLALAACGTDDPPQPELFDLPGNAYFPESLSASADGTLFVGSLATGQVTAFANGATEGRTVVGDATVTGVAGVHVEGDELWLCSVDTTFQRPTELRSFALDGTPREAFSLGAGFCNDLAFDAAGRLYVTDSFSGTVLRLEDGALVPWLEDPALAPAMAGAFGLDGIAFTGGALYVTKFDTGGVYRIAIAADGSAGAVTELGTFASPDGLRALGEDSLLLVEGAGRLVRLAIAGGTPTVLADDLDMPTAVVHARGSAWVTEGQLGRLFAGEAPNLPFAVRRVDL